MNKMGFSMANIFVPSISKMSESDVWAWYNNIVEELEHINFSAREEALVRSYYESAGLLKKWRRGFFRHHYSSSFASAARFLVDDNANSRILDIGCGIGTQSLFLALLGHEVIAVDLDRTSLAILGKRQRFYEEVAGRRLNIIYQNKNAFDVEYEKLSPINGVYSMFAFNMIQPSSTLLQEIVPSLSSCARVAIIDGNSVSWISKWLLRRRRNTWAPVEFSQYLAKQGFSVIDHRGGVALPPVLFAFKATRGAVIVIDRWLCSSWRFAVSHQVLARR